MPQPVKAAPTQIRSPHRIPPCFLPQYEEKYQGGEYVELLSTSGKKPLSQWRWSSAGGGVAKRFDKRVKGFVFVPAAKVAENPIVLLRNPEL